MPARHPANNTLPNGTGGPPPARLEPWDDTLSDISDTEPLPPPGPPEHPPAPEPPADSPADSPADPPADPPAGPGPDPFVSRFYGPVPAHPPPPPRLRPGWFRSHHRIHPPPTSTPRLRPVRPRSGSDVSMMDLLPGPALPELHTDPYLPPADLPPSCWAGLEDGNRPSLKRDLDTYLTAFSNDIDRNLMPDDVGEPLPPLWSEAPSSDGPPPAPALRPSGNLGIPRRQQRVPPVRGRGHGRFPVAAAQRASLPAEDDIPELDLPPPAIPLPGPPAEDGIPELTLPPPAIPLPGLSHAIAISVSTVGAGVPANTTEPSVEPFDIAAITVQTWTQDQSQTTAQGGAQAVSQTVVPVRTDAVFQLILDECTPTAAQPGTGAQPAPQNVAQAGTQGQPQDTVQSESLTTAQTAVQAETQVETQVETQAEPQAEASVVAPSQDTGDNSDPVETVVYLGGDDGNDESIYVDGDSHQTTTSAADNSGEQSKTDNNGDKTTSASTEPSTSGAAVADTAPAAPRVEVTTTASSAPQAATAATAPSDPHAALAATSTAAAASAADTQSQAYADADAWDEMLRRHASLQMATGEPPLEEFETD
ncbi:hypothetical protein ABW21_db0202020 [Orbilia brochopaga]|nr:hypothetical protein ABW21_db0202020 [Drechslerella brochopaga]